MFKRKSIFLLAVLIAASGSFASAEVTQDDLRMLGLMFRNRYVPYSKQADANPEVKSIAESMGGGGRGAQTAGDPNARYAALSKGLALMISGKWNEGVEFSTIMDMRLPAKIFNPGDTVKVKLSPLFERAEPIKEHYMVNLQLLGPDGKEIGKPGMMHFDKLEAAEVPISLPADLAAGQYTIRYTIQPHHGADKSPLLTGRRILFVLPGVKTRVQALATKAESLKSLGAAEKGKRQALALETINWFADLYQKALKVDVPGAYSGHPMFMSAVITDLSPQANMAFERIDFASELKLAEDLTDGLAQGKDPLARHTGDMRLAYKSSADGELVPFRIVVPENYDPAKSYPLVIALHGAGGDENSFMDRYDGLFKANLAKHGYIGVAVNGRGPYGGYSAKSGQDPLDVIDLIQATYPIDKKRTYLMGHSMGGFGTVLVGFNNADRFAAIAPIAGFGAATQLDKAKEMPMLMAQGDQDALVPVESARAFYQAAQERKMPNVKYIEKAGVEHLQIPNKVMGDIFDFFDAHTKK